MPVVEAPSTEMEVPASRMISRAMIVRLVPVTAPHTAPLHTKWRVSKVFVPDHCTAVDTCWLVFPD